ncbi:MAG: formate/nitrite transporter family protein [Candidatus Saccharibacteria bacterium]|nr:formate/nitrite transporter family protein [Candidatus Saccharibacteria bacterium]
MRKKSSISKKQLYTELLSKSAAAALLIGLGDYVLLKLGNPLGPFLFSFGLLGVCVMGANLFTGKCGFLFEDKIKPLHLALILAGNLVAGYLFGLMFSVCDSTIVTAAQEKVASWDFSWAFFIKSILCGVIMYLAVAIYRKGSKLGILLGVPLFIFCGFQHCIANIITLGVAQTFSWTIVICIAGNFIGSLAVWYLSRSKSN